MHFLCLKYSIGLLFLIVSFSCNVKRNFHSNNKVIEQLYKKDNEVRLLDAQTDTVNLERYDKVHREKIFQLLANGEVKTPIDKIRAAWILQHTAAKICDGELTSISPENFLLAYQLSSSAWDELIEKKDSSLIKNENIPRIVALNLDRYLLFTLGYQKFGTQFVFDDSTGEMLLAPINTTLSSDTERKKHNVETLNELLLKYKMKPHQKIIK